MLTRTPCGLTGIVAGRRGAVHDIRHRAAHHFRWVWTGTAPLFLRARDRCLIICDVFCTDIYRPATAACRERRASYPQRLAIGNLSLRGHGILPSAPLVSHRRLVITNVIPCCLTLVDHRSPQPPATQCTRNSLNVRPSNLPVHICIKVTGASYELVCSTSATPLLALSSYLRTCLPSIFELTQWSVVTLTLSVHLQAHTPPPIVTAGMSTSRDGQVPFRRSRCLGTRAVSAAASNIVDRRPER